MEANVTSTTLTNSSRSTPNKLYVAISDVSFGDENMQICLYCLQEACLIALQAEIWATNKDFVRTVKEPILASPVVCPYMPIDTQLKSELQ